MAINKIKPIFFTGEFEEALASTENIEYLKEMSKARTIEAMRTATKINDDLLGIEGTFRTLNFD